MRRVAFARAAEQRHVVRGAGPGDEPHVVVRLGGCRVSRVARGFVQQNVAPPARRLVPQNRVYHRAPSPGGDRERGGQDSGLRVLAPRAAPHVLVAHLAGEKREVGFALEHQRVEVRRHDARRADRRERPRRQRRIRDVRPGRKASRHGDVPGLAPERLLGIAEPPAREVVAALRRRRHVAEQPPFLLAVGVGALRERRQRQLCVFPERLRPRLVRERPVTRHVREVAGDLVRGARARHVHAHDALGARQVVVLFFQERRREPRQRDGARLRARRFAFRRRRRLRFFPFT